MYYGQFFNIFRLEEDGVLTDCNIKTLEADEVLDFNFCSSNVVNKIIMKVRNEILVLKTSVIKTTLLWITTSKFLLFWQD